MFQFSQKSLDGFKYLRKDQWAHYYSIEIRGVLVINDACCNTLQILCSKFLSFNYLSNDLSKQILYLFTLFPWKSLSVFQDLIMRLKIKYNLCV